MLGRSPALTPLAMLLALAVLLLGAGPARAHRLVVDYEVLPGNQVQLSSRYKAIPRSFPAQGARVRVFRASGQTLIEGQTDENGQFVFSYPKPEALTAEVYQEGHRAEVRIDAKELGASADTEVDRRPAREKAAPGEDRGEEWVKEVLAGVGFVLALAAFVLSLRNARQLRELSRLNHKGHKGHGEDKDREEQLGNKTG